MSFIDSRFPETYAYGAVSSDDWMTEVVESLARTEYRNAPAAHPRRVWDLSTTFRTQAERDGIHKFFLAMRGQLHAFPFRDLQDYQSARGNIGTGNGTAVAFQLIKNYIVGSEVYSRPITKPVVSTVRVWVNNSEITTGWSVSRATGIVTFTSPPANGYAIEASCEFDVPVRFASSRLGWAARDRHAGELAYVCESLQLIEVIGE